ncbi:MAG: hypothetical protein C0469_10370 [Cyanobacteria bacterium DS2.3.42]|nr:hypothetical protein [Cyanobacteria bacterium DS2.3.42]
MRMLTRNLALNKIHMSALLTALFCASFFTPSIRAFGADSAAEAYKLYQAKRYKEAAQMFEGCLTAQKPDANVLYYAAVCNQEAGNLGRAKALYKQVVQLSPGSTIAQYSEKILTRLDPAAQMTAAGAAYNPYRRAQTNEREATVSGPDEARVYFKQVGRAMYIPVEIDNRSVEMILDTGAPGILLGKNQLSRIGLRLPDGPALGQSGGAANTLTQNFYGMTATVKVGPFSMSNAQIKVLENNMAPPLLGQEFLKFFDYTVDQGAHSIHLVRKGSGGAVAKSGYSIPFEFREGGNRIVVEAEINGRKARLMMDTGNSATGITFHSVGQAKDYGLAPPADARIGLHSGVSGSGKAYQYYANRVKLGPIDRSKLRVAANLDGNDSELPLLGHEFFEGWQYNVDLKERKIWLLRR